VNPACLKSRQLGTHLFRKFYLATKLVYPFFYKQNSCQYYLLQFTEDGVELISEELVSKVVENIHAEVNDRKIVGKFTFSYRCNN